MEASLQILEGEGLTRSFRSLADSWRAASLRKTIRRIALRWMVLIPLRARLLCRVVMFWRRARRSSKLGTLSMAAAAETVDEVASMRDVMASPVTLSVCATAAM